MLISLNNASKTYDFTTILNNVSISVKKGDKIAILGQNGAGKSSLLKILSKKLDADSGELIYNIAADDYAYLSQNSSTAQDISVKEVLLNSMQDLKIANDRFTKINSLLEEEIKEIKITKSLSKNEILYKDLEAFKKDELINLQTNISNFINDHNGWNIEDKIEQIIIDYDLEELKDKNMLELSGGEKKRVEIAAMLVESKAVLFLDEITNHLDIKIVKTLETMLNDKNLTIVFISHDRSFIEAIANKIVEICDTKLLNFSGNYSAYLRQKQELINAKKKESDNLNKLLKSELEWLSKSPSGRTKRNMGRVERIENLKQAIKDAPKEIRNLSLNMDKEIKSFNSSIGNTKKVLFEIENLGFKRGNRRLIEDFTYRIKAKDALAIVGPNGIGKSTLAKLLIGDLSPTSGTIKQALNLKIGYFDQEMKILGDEEDIISLFCPNGGDIINVNGQNMHIFGYLKKFLFDKENLTKKINILSGGEKKRLALALLFTKNYDVLILDEPTNDLDIPTINILEQYLASSNSALIIISHDRYFLDKLSPTLLVFRGDGRIETSMQSFSNYIENLDFEKSSTTKQKEMVKKETKEEKKKTKLSYRESLLLAQLPEQIAKIEEEIKEIEFKLNDSANYHRYDLSALSGSLAVLKTKNEELIEKYLELEILKEEIEK